MIIIIIMIGIIVSDLNSYIIPDIFALMILINRLFYIDDIIYIYSGLSISMFILIVSKILEYINKKEMMGGADIKLYFVFGIYFMFIENIMAVLLSCISGIIFSLILKRNKIAFGPCICLAYLLLFIDVDRVMGVYYFIIKIV